MRPGKERFLNNGRKLSGLSGFVSLRYLFYKVLKLTDIPGGRGIFSGRNLTFGIVFGKIQIIGLDAAD